MLNKVKLAFSIIIKDDSEVSKFKESLYSVIPYVNFVQITSNGKKTAEIEDLVKSTSSRFPNIEIDYTHLPWTDDFSAQRNHSFNRIPKDYDYIYWQDADDILVGGEYLQQVATESKKNGKDVVFFEYWYGCEFNGKPGIDTFVDVDIKHYRERLIRPGVVEWKGRLHETPVEVRGQKNNYTKFEYDKDERPLAVMHTAVLEDSLIKMGRNRRILELQLEEERSKDGADPRTLLYLMKIYSEIGDENLLRKCIGMGYEYLEKSGWDEERGNCYDLMSICSTKLGEYDSTINFLHKATEEYPHNPIYYVRLAIAYYNIGRHKQAKHWLNIVANLDQDKDTAGISNIKELKILFAQILMKISYYVDKDLDRAYQAAKLLYKEQPNEENKENLTFMYERVALKEASEHALQLLKYLEQIGDKEAISKVINSLPKAISEQPFAISYLKKVINPRVWGENEICYFANFGGKHFEKWDENSLKTGVGGSETAVIKLAEEWGKMGYKVTVYGDPEEEHTVGNVTYVPWYKFNKADKFNIFIQWRMPMLATTIKAKKFLVDLHDVCHQVDYPKNVVDAIDKIMVKSEYHRQFLPDVPDEKISVISNGI